MQLQPHVYCGAKLGSRGNFTCFLPLYLLYRSFCTKENYLPTQQNTLREKIESYKESSVCTVATGEKSKRMQFARVQQERNCFVSRVAVCFIYAGSGGKQQEAKQSIVIRVFSVNSVSI
jgi:hypothetical protein